MPKLPKRWSIIAECLLPRQLICALPTRVRLRPWLRDGPGIPPQLCGLQDPNRPADSEAIFVSRMMCPEGRRRIATYLRSLLVYV